VKKETQRQIHGRTVVTPVQSTRLKLHRYDNLFLFTSIIITGSIEKKNKENKS